MASAVLSELQRDLEASESLLVLGALTVGDVEATLRRALTYVQRVQARDSDNRDEQAIYRTQLNSELDLIAQLDRSSPAPADQWPRQRRAIERAYFWTEANGALVDQDARDAGARADALNEVLDKAGEAGKGLGQGLEGVLQLVIVLVVVLVIAQFAGRTA
jgi:hypothetical protein